MRARIPLPGLLAFLLASAALGLGAGLGPASTAASAAGPDARPLQGTPTPVPVEVRGLLLQPTSGCAPAQARLRRCDGSGDVPVYADVDLSPYLNTEVRLVGAPEACPDGGTYLRVLAISPGTCDPATPTPQPPPPSSENLARGAEVLASTEGAPGRGPERITDGDLGTEWAVPPGRAAWARIDLGRDRVFNEFRLHWGATHATTFALYVWDPTIDEDGDYRRVYYTTSGAGNRPEGFEEITIARAEGRYLLIYLVTSSTPARGFELREWEVFGSETPNLALGANEVIPSSSDPLHAGRYVTDGDPLTRWRSDPATDPDPARPTILLRFASRIDISEIRLLWHELEYAFRYRIHFYQGAQDLPVWINAENPDGGRDSFSWLGTLSVDGVMLVTDRIWPATDRISLREIQLFSLAPGSLWGDGALDAGLLAQPRAEGARLTGWGPDGLVRRQPIRIPIQPEPQPRGEGSDIASDIASDSTTDPARDAGPAAPIDAPAPRD